jgi:hypothetical protein
MDGRRMTPAAELDSILCRLCLYREARGESLAAKTAVLAVIRNRANDPKNRWPKTLAGVVLQPFQFSSFNAKDPNVTAWPKAPIVPSVKPPYSADWLSWLDCCAVWDSPLTADPVAGAQYYCDVSKPLDAFAREILGHGKTAADLEACKTAQIGRLIFFHVP